MSKSPSARKAAFSASKETDVWPAHHVRTHSETSMLANARNEGGICPLVCTVSTYHGSKVRKVITCDISGVRKVRQ